MPRGLFQKAIGRVSRGTRHRAARKRDLNKNTREWRASLKISHSYLTPDSFDLTAIDPEVATYLAEMYLDHRFDLLGSGWVINSYDSVARGLEGHRFAMNLKVSEHDSAGEWLTDLLVPAHLDVSQTIWQRLSSEYHPIDWQKDYKSGYRWSAKTWYKDQPITPAPGVDIKVPWELSRLQHLPRMALIACMLPKYRERLTIEFRNQVLDFLATNPPRMGVNWVCTMDVAIRAANLALAYDLFSRLDDNQRIDQDFRKQIANSLYEHGLHIVDNLEFYERLTTNHYLANIAGLLFVAAYLPCDEEIDCWLAFALQELKSEMGKQFYTDGGNFEASTCYHLLSTEMMVYATGLALGLPDDKRRAARNCDGRLWKRQPAIDPETVPPPSPAAPIEFPEWYRLRLQGAVGFCKLLRKPTGEIPQIGDNDSGRFFKLTPVGEFLSTADAAEKYLNLSGYDEPHSRYWDENLLNPGHLIAAASPLFADAEFDTGQRHFLLEKSLIRSLSKRVQLQTGVIDCNIPTMSSVASPSPATVDRTLTHTRQTVIEPLSQEKISLTNNLQVLIYRDTGIVFMISDRIHLTICAGSVGQRGIGGHSHNDKLSFELNLDSIDRMLDPGTYLYLPLLEKRNLFRSAIAHQGPIATSEEPNRWSKGVEGAFCMRGETECRICEVTENSVLLSLCYRKVEILRKFTIDSDRIIIADRANVPLGTEVAFEFYSRGYGKLERMPRRMTAG